MIYYHIINCLIPQAFIDDDEFPAQLFVPDEYLWQHFVHSPNRYVYSKGSGNFILPSLSLHVEEDSWQHSIRLSRHHAYSRSINASVPIPPPAPLHIDEDAWQQSLTLNLNTKVSLWRDNDGGHFIASSYLRVDEDAWQQSLSINLKTQATLWLNDESVHK
jgi:hypothetical protein